MIEYGINKKRGFTLAEILIVLVVIGVISTLIIPSLMTGVHNYQYKAAYSRALNIITNLTASQKVSGQLPSRTSDENADKLFDELNSNLSVSGYISSDIINLGSGKMAEVNEIESTKPEEDGRYKYWITTEDGFAFLVTKSTSGATDQSCWTKREISAKQNTIASYPSQAPSINSGKTNDPFSQNTCFVIYVDVNGVAKGPNTAFANYLANGEKVPALVNDIFPIYVGLDGAVAGDQNITITGRVSSDLK